MLKQVPKAQNVGIYCRLSKDDGTDAESSSIGTQKAILTDYVKQQGWHLVDTYVDDGYSGTNFQRPRFQDMIRDIEAGRIDCVITKDLSRLGRNYLDCGLYLEVFFPEHGVRYIAVNDSVDTLNKAAMDITPFRNILNDMYAADISMKIKSSKRVRFLQGKFVAGLPPYGYRKDPEDRNHLVIDEKAAPVVRLIFDLAMKGWGIARIRAHINGQRILRPAAYALEQGHTGFESYFENDDANRYLWSPNSIRSVLRNPTYAGHLVGYKRPAISLRSKKRPSRLPEDWEIVPNTHEAIVSQEVFDTVQRLMTSRRRVNKSGYNNIFAGLVKCADCGYHMSAGNANRVQRPDVIDCTIYTCANYTREGNLSCTSHSIEARDLTNAVLADINHYANMAMNDPKAVMAIQQRLDSISTSEAKTYERERRKLSKRLAELDKLFIALYEDKVMERIAERNYELMSQRYEREQHEIDGRLKAICDELDAKGISDKSASAFVSTIQGFQGLTELTAATLNALIEKITVSERRVNEDGAKEQSITIYYKFVGTIHEPLRIPVVKRVMTRVQEKPCNMCGSIFLPNTNGGKYCPDCQGEAARQRGVRSNNARLAKRRVHRAAHPKTLPDKPCAICGTNFPPVNHLSRYCTDCQGEAARRRMERNMEQQRLKRVAKRASYDAVQMT